MKEEAKLHILPFEKFYSLITEGKLKSDLTFYSYDDNIDDILEISYRGNQIFNIKSDNSKFDVDQLFFKGNAYFVVEKNKKYFSITKKSGKLLAKVFNGIKQDVLGIRGTVDGDYFEINEESLGIIIERHDELLSAIKEEEDENYDKDFYLENEDALIYIKGVLDLDMDLDLCVARLKSKKIKLMIIKEDE